MKSECNHIRDLIADSVTETLGAEEARHLDEHLEQCADCRRYAEALRHEDLRVSQLAARVATDMPDRKERLLQVLDRCVFEHVNEPMRWRRIMTSRAAKLTVAAIVILGVPFGVSLLEKSSAPAYGMTEALDLIDKAKTLHFRKWHVDRRGSPPEEIKLPGEEWHDLENGRYRLEQANVGLDGEVITALAVCDGQYIMSTGAYQPVGDRVHHTIDFEKVDPNQASNARKILGWYRQVRGIEGFHKIRQDTIDGQGFDMWEGTYTIGGDRIDRFKLEVWLSPATAVLGAVKVWKGLSENEWQLTSECAGFEYNVPLVEELFRTEPPGAGYEIRESKETAKVRTRRGWLDHDIYEGTEFGYAPLNYCVAPVFALSHGVLLAGYRSVDAQEPQDQSKYFAGLQIGGPLAKLPVEAFALSPEPNARNVLFMGFHLAHTQKQTPKGPRWFEWILYVPDKEPPKPEAVLMYRIQYRRNVPRTEDVDISVKQIATDEPQEIETKEAFDRLVLGAIAGLSDGGAVPKHVTYENVLQIAGRVRASITR